MSATSSPTRGPTVDRGWIPRNPRTRPGKRLSRKVTGVIIGDTGRPGLTAADAAGRADHAVGHLIVDDKSVIECVPAVTDYSGIVEEAPYFSRMPGMEAAAQIDPESAICITLCYGRGIDPNDAYRRCVALAVVVCDRFELCASTQVKPASALDRKRRDPHAPLSAAGRSFDKLLADLEWVRNTDFDLMKGTSSLDGAARSFARIEGPGEARGARALAIRKGAPSRLAPVERIVQAGEKIEYSGRTDHGEEIDGLASWYYRNGSDHVSWFWAGGVTLG